MLIKQTKEMTEAERIATENSNNQYLQALSYVAVGTIYPFAAEKPPDTFMLCDGSALDVTEYAELFDVIGYSYGGAGDTFNLPDLRGRTIVGHNPADSVCIFIIKVCQGVCTGISGDTSVVFLGGDATSTLDVEIVVDHELSAASDNPVSNKAVTKPLKAAQNDIKNLQENVCILESGTSGDWTYRIWSDGTAECWATFEYWNEILNPNWVVRTVAYNRAFPFIFTDVPTVTATLNNLTMWHHFLVSVNVSAEEFDSFCFMGYAGQEVQVSGNINLYLKGKVELGVG